SRSNHVDSTAGLSTFPYHPRPPRREASGQNFPYFARIRLLAAQFAWPRLLIRAYTLAHTPRRRSHVKGTSSRRAQIIVKHEQDVLAQWIKEQTSAATSFGRR